MIEFQNVTKTYSKNVVDNLNLEVRDGEIFGFIGPNGAGKTTTIKMLIGVTAMSAGEIMIDGVNLKQNPVLAKSKFGYVPDSPDVFLKLKGIEYLNFMADIYGVDKNLRTQRIKEFAQRFSMEEALNNKIESYSHGMRQKVVIMGALISEPNLWILDEPMTGLDPKTSHELKEMMKEHTKKGNTVFFSTHVLEVAEKLCDRVAIIKEGKIMFVGTLSEMRQKFDANASLEEMFLEMTENE